MKERLNMRKVLATGLVIAAVLWGALPAAAAGHGHKVQAAGLDSLSVSPTAPAQGQLFTVQGTSFGVSTDYNVHTLWPTGNESQVGVTTDASGTFDLNEYAYFGGSYTIDVYATVAGGDQGTLVASFSFSTS